MAIGAADQEGEILRALIEMALQELRETFAGKSFSMFIEYQGKGLGRQCAGEKPGFFSLALACGLALRLGEVSNRQFCYPSLAAKSFETGLVILGENFFWPRL